MLKLLSHQDLPALADVPWHLMMLHALVIGEFAHGYFSSS